MQPFTPAELLAVWERGWPQQQPERALTFLAAARPEAAPEELLALPVGARDADILALRRENFGDAFTGITTCPHCAETVELSFTAADVHAATGTPRNGAMEVTSGDRVCRFRLPGTADVIAAAASGDPRAVLLERCAENATPDDLEAIAEAMRDSDPMAGVELTIGCPECGEAFRRPFDIVSFFWSEVQSRARRVAEEVHALARAYGWREGEILALTPWRRRLYVELAR